MTVSYLAYEREREGEQYPVVMTFWCNSGVLLIKKTTKANKFGDGVSINLIPSELKEILKSGEGSFESSKQIYLKTRITPGLFPKNDTVVAIAHPNGDIEIQVHYHTKTFSGELMKSIIVLSFGEWKTILSKCQKKGREIWKDIPIASGAGIMGD